MAIRNLKDWLATFVVLAAVIFIVGLSVLYLRMETAVSTAEASTISPRAEPVIYFSDMAGSLEQPSPNTISVATPSVHFVVTRTEKSSQLEEGILLNLVRTTPGVDVYGSSTDDAHLVVVGKPLNIRRDVIILSHYRFQIIVKDQGKRVLQCNVEIPMHRLSNGMIVICS